MAGNQAELVSLIQRLELVTSRLEKVPGAGGAAASSNKDAGASSGSSASLQAFDQIVTGSFQNYLDLSKKIGDDVAKQASTVESAFTAQRVFLGVAAGAKKPTDQELAVLLKPTSDKINEIQTHREAQRRSQFFNHLSAISESISALGWVAVSPAPSPFVKDMCDAGQFYTNRVLKDWKEKSKTHVEWTKAWLATLGELMAFVKEYHTTGLVWNPNGGSATQLAGSAGPRPVTSGGPPPPPPPPPPGLFSDLKTEEKAETKAINALFADINKGEGVTQGLKKVTADMQTHKNPSLRDNAPIVAPKPKAGSPPAAVAAKAAPQRPPRFELEGKKWAVEFQRNNQDLVIQNTDMNQSVYIYRCEGSTVKVEGKVNNIILDGCKKTAVVFQDVVSACEFINCQSVQMQVLGKVPTISVEKTDGCQMYLSPESLAVEIVSAKSSEMNVVIPSGDDFVEQPIPEQFKTTLSGTKLTTIIAESV